MTDIYKLLSEATALRPASAKMSIEDMEAEMRILYTLANLSLAGDIAPLSIAADIPRRGRDLREVVTKYFDSTTSLKKRSRTLLTLYRLITELPMPGNESKLLTDYYRRVDAVYNEWLHSSKRDVATNAWVFSNLVNYFTDIDNIPGSKGIDPACAEASAGDVDPRLTLIHGEAAAAIEELTPIADGYHWQEMETSVALHRLSFLAAYCHGFHISTPPPEYLGALRHYTATIFNRLTSSETIPPSLLRMLIQVADIHFITPGEEDFTLPHHLTPTLTYPLLSILIRTTLSPHLLTHSHAS